LQDGYFGQSVKVLNTESGRNVMGVVTGRGKVVIESER
jgi:flagella basal body P-ring formation protein FlgA